MRPFTIWTEKLHDNQNKILHQAPVVSMLLHFAFSNIQQTRKNGLSSGYLKLYKMNDYYLTVLSIQRISKSSTWCIQEYADDSSICTLQNIVLLIVSVTLIWKVALWCPFSCNLFWCWLGHMICLGIDALVACYSLRLMPWIMRGSIQAHAKRGGLSIVIAFQVTLVFILCSVHHLLSKITYPIPCRS